jgi:phosphatidylglycerol---prolipoprotein diacylglyceryl transferase
MQFPVYIHIGPWTLHPHLVFEALGYFLGFRLYRFLRKRRGDAISNETRWSVVAAAAAGGAIGSKVLYWFEDPWQTLSHWNDPVYLMSGKTIVGGLLGGLIAVEMIKMMIGEQRRTGDLFAAPLVLGIAVGRVGCFLTGLADHTYGIRTSLPWGVDFGDGMARHPVQLYEAVFALVLCVYLFRYTSGEHVRGDGFKAFMVGYLGFRLLIDFLKPGVSMMGLTGIQWACVAGLLYYASDIRRWITGRDPHESDATAASAASD